MALPNGIHWYFICKYKAWVEDIILKILINNILNWRCKKWFFIQLTRWWIILQHQSCSVSKTVGVLANDWKLLPWGGVNKILVVVFADFPHVNTLNVERQFWDINVISIGLQNSWIFNSTGQYQLTPAHYSF